MGPGERRGVCMDRARRILGDSTTRGLHRTRVRGEGSRETSLQGGVIPAGTGGHI